MESPDLMQPLVSSEFAALVQRCSCAPCAALRSALGAAVVKVPNRQKVQHRSSQITETEKHMLGLLGLGLSNREIAARLGLLEQSIKRQMRALCRKLGVKNRTAAALRAAELCLVPYQGQQPVAVPAMQPAATLLTDDEQRTLGLVGQGLSNKGISRVLHLAESTVKNRLSAIYKKLGVLDRTQAALTAVRLGLVRVEGGGPRQRRRIQRTDRSA
jgi:DNA-binding NarL/FixJ family response regulator